MVCNSLFWFCFLSVFVFVFSLCLSVKVVREQREQNFARAYWMDFDGGGGCGDAYLSVSYNVFVFLFS